MGERGDPREYTCVTCKTTAWGANDRAPGGWFFVIDAGFGGGFCTRDHAYMFFTTLTAPDTAREVFIEPLIAEQERLTAIVEQMELVWMAWLEGGDSNSAMEALAVMAEPLAGGSWRTP